jgi:putative ABC transport system permease protein
VRGRAALRAAAGGVGRHWVQTAVMFVVVGIAAVSGVLGLTLATNSNASFKKALVKRRAPDIVVMIDASKVTAAEVARTRQLRGVTQAAGPYPATTITLASVSGSVSGAAQASQPLTVVGRASRNGPLDDLVCFTSPPGITSCGWPTRTGEIELSSFAPVQIGPGGGRLGPVGEKVTVRSVPSGPTLSVVGYAEGILQQDADAWAVPAEITALEKAGAPTQEQMLYTFRRASSNAQISADLAELQKALPAGAIISSASLPNMQHFATAGSAQKPPYVEAFAVIALLLALLITGIVVAAAVLASYRRIGVLKSIGFTPAQVVASYLAQVAAPAIAGATFGTLVGSDWATQLIKGWDANAGVPPWIKLTVPVAVCALVALASLIPAVRAAKLTAVQAIAAGQSLQTAHGPRLSRLVGRLPLPRPVALGIASAFSRPGASLAAGAVIASGLAAAVLAVGLNSQMLQLVVGATTPQNGAVLSGQALVRGLTILVAVVAALGVLSAVIMLARQRVHDLGVYKAIGMTPRQIILTVVSWIIVPTIAAAVIALPAGVVLEHAVAQTIVRGQTGALSQVVPPGGGAGRPPPRPSRTLYQRPTSSGVHPRVVDLPSGASGASGSAYAPGTLALLALAGLAVAIAGALGPAMSAAFSKATTALHAE